MKEFKLAGGNLGLVVSEITKLVLSSTKSFRLTIVEWREKRSLSQNSMMWMWMTEIDKQKPLKCDTGEFKGSELWHEVFKKYYCDSKQITDGDNYMVVKTTTLLDVGEMTHYLNKIESWCMDKGIKLTIPEDSEYYKLMEYQCGR